MYFGRVRRCWESQGTFCLQAARILILRGYTYFTSFKWAAQLLRLKAFALAGSRRPISRRANAARLTARRETRNQPSGSSCGCTAEAVLLAPGGRDGAGYGTSLGCVHAMFVVSGGSTDLTGKASHELSGVMVHEQDGD